VLLGPRGHFWLDILRTLLGYFPGLIHAIRVIGRHERRRTAPEREEIPMDCETDLGVREEARQRVERYLADSTDLTEQEIEQRLDQWERQARETAREAGEAGEGGAEAIGKAALWTAAGSLVALLAAGAGGAVGAASASPRRRKARRA
jgi:hypothetical protein